MTNDSHYRDLCRPGRVFDLNAAENDLLGQLRRKFDDDRNLEVLVCVTRVYRRSQGVHWVHVHPPWRIKMLA